MTNKRDEKTEDNFYKKRQKKPIKWENLLTKCKKCGSTEIEKMNMYKGMFKKKSDNYQLHRCKSCGCEVWLRL